MQRSESYKILIYAKRILPRFRGTCARLKLHVGLGFISVHGGCDFFSERNLIIGIIARGDASSGCGRYASVTQRRFMRSHRVTLSKVSASITSRDTRKPGKKRVRSRHVLLGVQRFMDCTLGRREKKKAIMLRGSKNETNVSFFEP